MKRKNTKMNLMRPIILKFDKKTLNFDLVILFLILSIPFLNLWYLNVYRAKLKLICIVFIILLILNFFAQIETLRKPKIVYALLIYFAVSSVLFNFPTSTEYLIVVLFGSYVMSIKQSDKMLEQMMKAFVVVGLFFSITLLWQKFSPSTFYPILKIFVSESQYYQAINYTYAGDYTGFACESHCACLCIVPGASILFSQLFFNKTRRGHFIGKTLVFCLLLCAMFFSGRRAYVLFFPAILICCAIYFLLKKRNSIAKLLGVFLIALVVALLYFVLFNQIIDLLTGGTGEEIQLSNRLGYWQLAFNMFSKAPLTGAGMRSYDYQYNQMSGRNITFAGAHNCYLQMLAETGVIGTVLFYGMVVFMLFKTVRLTIFCVRNNSDEFGSYALMSLIMQCVFICLAMSESVFFAPYSAILYFVILSVVNNVAYRVEYNGYKSLLEV